MSNIDSSTQSTIDNLIAKVCDECGLTFGAAISSDNHWSMVCDIVNETLKSMGIKVIVE